MAALALVIALGGGTATAARLLTGADVRDGAIRSVDVRNGSVGRVDFRAGTLPRGARGPAGAKGPAGPPGPTAPEWPAANAIPLTSAAVAADGTVTRTDGPVTVVRSSTGVYCVTVPEAVWVRATSAAVAAPQSVATSTDTGACADSATAVVSVGGPSGPEDGPFGLLVRETP